VLDVDIPDIAAAFGNDIKGQRECMERLENALDRIRLNPDREGTWCEFEPLKSAGSRKVKEFSSKSLERTKEAKPDMRIIYRYDGGQDTVRVDSMGFRVRVRPRPDHDPYSKAERRIRIDE